MNKDAAERADAFSHSDCVIVHKALLTDSGWQGKYNM